MGSTTINPCDPELVLYKKLIEKIALPVLILDETGRIMFANRGAKTFTGYSTSELQEIFFRDLCASYEQNRYIFSYLSKIHELTELEIDLRIKSGQCLMTSIIFSPFEHHDTPCLLLVLRDVTNRRIQENQLRETKERYRRLLDERNRLEVQLARSAKLACMGELSAGIAHEINNPLGIILGFAQDILDDISEDSPIYESVKIIEKETTRCVDVVKNLLDLSRLKQPQISDVDISLLVADTIALLNQKFRKNNIQQKIDFEKNLPFIRVDPLQIQQALLNVMINAVQSMPLGGVLSVQIRMVNVFHLEREKSFIQITIADTGQGIPEDVLSRIFDPFFSTKGSKGTGLGLAVCQRIIEDHSGKIEIESTEGIGTTCFIRLPYLN
ncbi:MAG: nitrogen regulation protein NR(II) [Desulfatirhabdiaceae bacterium]